jgi:hypothetical protein
MLLAPKLVLQTCTGTHRKNANVVYKEVLYWISSQKRTALIRIILCSNIVNINCYSDVHSVVIYSNNKFHNETTTCVLNYFPFSVFRCHTFQNSTNLWCNWPEKEERVQLLIIFIQKGWAKFWRISFKLMTADDSVKTNVLGLRDTIFAYDIQRHVSNDQALIKDL